MKNFKINYDKEMYEKVMRKLYLFSYMKQATFFTMGEIAFLYEYIQNLEMELEYFGEKND